MKSIEFRRILREILRLPTAPFHETAVRDYVIEHLRRWRVPYRIDRAGNVIAAIRRGKPAGSPLALAAHMDHPGFWVERIIRRRNATEAVVRALGGVGKIRKGMSIRFFSAPPVTGRVLSADRRGRATVLLKSAIPVGTPGRWDVPGVRIRNSKIFAPGIDDVAGVAVMLEVLRRLSSDRHRAVRLFCCFTRAEEVGFVGAGALAQSRILPARTQIISIEMSRALPGRAEQGRGFVVRVGDRASLFDPRLGELLIQTARRMTLRRPKFLFQTAVLDGGACEATLFNALGYAASGVAVPLGNYHNQTPAGGIGPEFIDLRDIDSLAGFLTALPFEMRRLDHLESERRGRMEKNIKKWRGFLK